MPILDSFFLTEIAPPNTLSGNYVLGFVILSYFIAVFGSFTTILLSERMQETNIRLQATLYRIIGAVALGTSIWTMHFVGMFAYHFSLYVQYDIGTTILSWLFAIFFSYTSLSFVKTHMTIWHYISCAFLAGTAVTAMHYIGMKAMIMDATLLYYPGLFGLSYIIAILASGAATWIITSLIQYNKDYKKLLQILSACVMGIAVCGMHYIGMLAAAIIPNENCRYDTNQDTMFFISIIAFAGFCIILGSLFFALYRPRSNKHLAFKKRTSLSTLVILSFTILLFLMTASIWFIGNITSRVIISKWTKTQRRAVAETILEKLRKDTSQVESLAFTLMTAAQILPITEINTLKNIAPKILERPQTFNIIAGGGVWPEPYAFNPEKERDSYFWGKDNNEKFKFYDDYNTAPGPKYFQEEWYAPVRYMPEGKCYWSGSYVDPYSKEPMVTCSLKMKNNNKFIGVTTIDMRLKYVHNFLKSTSQNLGGYILLFDRDNRFISASSTIQLINDDNTFMTSDTFTIKNKWFSKINDQILKVNQIFRDHMIIEPSTRGILEKIKTILPTATTDISLNIAALIDQLQHKDNIGTVDDQISILTANTLSIDNDQFLGTSTDVNIFVDQTNHWKLIVATPKSLAVSESEKILFPILGTAILASSIALGIFYFIIRIIIILPLNHIVLKLEDQQKNGYNAQNKLYQGSNNELGMIKYLFDKRSDDLRNAVEIANKANREKSSFLANMSHELRTPLNGILGMLQLIDPKRVPDDIAEMHNLMSASGNNLLEIVNDILDLSKIEADGIKLESISFDLSRKIKETVQILLPLASSKGLSLSFIDRNEPTFVLGDPLRVSRIVTNLISNAIRYTDKGRIDVAMDINNEKESGKITAIISVKDTGIGIPKEKHSTIFEKFTQADNSTTRRFGGTGLGLAITKELVELMDGTIGLESTVGKGSKFWVILPFKETSKEDAPDKNILNISEPPVISSLNRLPIEAVRILVAEDHIMNQEFIKKLFQNLGVTHYTIVENGAQAVESVKTGNFDLVLMDCHMPDMDGYDATQTIRSLSDPHNHDIPIVAMTANAMSDDEERCLAIGMNAYISKPISIPVFKHKLSTWIEF